MGAVLLRWCSAAPHPLSSLSPGAVSGTARRGERGAALPSGSWAALGPVSSVASLLEPQQLRVWGGLSSAVQQQFTEILAVENKDLGTSVCMVSSD